LVTRREAGIAQIMIRKQPKADDYWLDKLMYTIFEELEETPESVNNDKRDVKSFISKVNNLWPLRQLLKEIINDEFDKNYQSRKGQDIT